jgi:hypothetical protein
LKNKFVLLLSGTVLSAMVLGGCNTNNNVNDDNVDHRGPLMRINNPANDNRNVDNNLNRNRIDNNNINNHDNINDPYNNNTRNNINDRNNINNRDNINDPYNNNGRNINNRGTINNNLNNNGNNNYLPPSKDKNTDTDKDFIKDSNTKKEDIIEDDIDRKDRDNRDE